VRGTTAATPFRGYSSTHRFSGLRLLRHGSRESRVGGAVVVRRTHGVVELLADPRRAVIDVVVVAELVAAVDGALRLVQAQRARPVLLVAEALIRPRHGRHAGHVGDTHSHGRLGGLRGGLVVKVAPEWRVVTGPKLSRLHFGLSKAVLAILEHARGLELLGRLGEVELIPLESRRPRALLDGHKVALRRPEAGIAGSLAARSN
jgi:hypothetical protein